MKPELNLQEKESMDMIRCASFIAEMLMKYGPIIAKEQEEKEAG